MATPSSADDITVTHNEVAHRFETSSHGQLAMCEYRFEGDRVIFTHTFVPSELRGRGIAEKLVRAALQWAAEKNHRIVAACSYVDVFVQRNPEFRVLLA